MSRRETVHTLIDRQVAAVLRFDEPDRLLRASEALLEGGLSVLEVTMTTPNAVELIAELSEAFAPHALIGVGSVVEAASVQRAADAGAQFVVSPVFDPQVVQAAHDCDRAAIPGAFTPTEIQRAHDHDADLVKVFPASTLGMDFLSAVQGPLPHLDLMPTGGVTLTSAADWLQAGAAAVGIGSALLDRNAIANDNYTLLEQNARTLRNNLKHVP